MGNLQAALSAVSCKLGYWDVLFARRCRQQLADILALVGFDGRSRRGGSLDVWCCY